MLKQISILTVFVILLFGMGCTEKIPISLSDCESIKSESERDNCFAKFVEISAINDVSRNIGACGRIISMELRDLCFFKVSQDSWRSMPADTLGSLCSNISSGPLRDSCKDITDRPHLQVIR